MKLAIIGTAGRKDDADKLTIQKWNEMKKVVARFVKEHKIEIAISGGAAYADHLAVGLYNAKLVYDLKLFLPCEFDIEKVKFLDNGSKDWRTNPGKISNWYHSEFSKKIGINSLEEMKKAILKGCAVQSGGGFFGRNDQVAKESDKLIAFTFGDGPIVKDGGTTHTVKQFLKNHDVKNAWHYDLNSMKLFQNAKVN